MKTPEFWYQDHASLTSTLLSPFAQLYSFFETQKRERTQSHCLPIPVICIGNLVVGGSGKTPCAISVMKHIQNHFMVQSPCFLTRGYKGEITGPVFVTPDMEARACGDEALLLARHARTCVAANRLDGAEYALEKNADLIVMDDGLQNNILQKDLTLCIIDGMMGFGNGQVIPAGPLRQTLETGFENCDAFILVGEDSHAVANLLPNDKPLFRARLTPTCSTEKWTVPYVAFCGIGFPQKFWKTLKDLGVTIVHERAFPDHHAYTNVELSELMSTARKYGARLITTEKDFVRIPAHTDKSIIDVLPVEIVFEDEAALHHFLITKIPSLQDQAPSP